MAMNPRVLIGVPCGETLHSRTAFSLFNLRGKATLEIQISADIAQNRNRLVERALHGDYTHLLFVDSDMFFAPDTLERMLAHDKDILGLACNRRKLPLESVVKPLKVEDENKPLPTKLFEAKSVGTGMLLIKTDVLKTLTHPIFDFQYRNGKRFGEDVLFCEKAREAGYQIWVDPTIPVNHIGTYLY